MLKGNEAGEIAPSGLRKTEGDGVHVAVVHKNGILLLKRRDIPFIRRFVANPGKWSLVAGGRKRGEAYIDTAYREVTEETGLERKQLNGSGKGTVVRIYDRGKGTTWSNVLFVLRSSSRSIRLNLESSDYKWVTFDELSSKKYLNETIMDHEAALRRIRKAIRR